MNHLLQKLNPYPFERLRMLFASSQEKAAASGYKHISLGMGEPRHKTPAVINNALINSIQNTEALAKYPATLGSAQLRGAFTSWIKKRYSIDVNPDNEVLPVLGTREALFSLAQASLSNSPNYKQLVLCPNPFYQIYEGAAILAGADIAYINSDEKLNFAPNWAQVPMELYKRAKLVYVCSPSNPTGSVMQLDDWKMLFELSEKYDFIIASDECYSEIYFDEENPPLGALEASLKLGVKDFKNLIMLTSLSKRSNAPGLRSGFVAGDKNIISNFLKYRTYHGSAMSEVIAAASIAAWSDENHVKDNRDKYRKKFKAVYPILKDLMDVQMPDAAFYLWAGVTDKFNNDSELFSKELFAKYNVTVLPGTYLSRESQKVNVGKPFVRMALVAEEDECIEAARRIAEFIKTY